MAGSSVREDEINILSEYHDAIINSAAFALTVIAIFTVLTQTTKVFDLAWVWVIVAGIAAFLFELFRALMKGL